MSIRFELNRQETVLRAITTRLAAIHDEPAFAESSDEWRHLLAELMVRPPPPNERVLLVIDGLDEAAGWQAGPSLWPAAPHQNVKLLASARLTAAHPGPEDWTGHLGWPAASAMRLDPLDMAGVRDVLLHMGVRLRRMADDPVAVARLHEITAGDPLVLGLYVGHLWMTPPSDADGALTGLASARPGLDGFIDQWWSDQERLWPDRAAVTAARRVFDLLACALGPLERRDVLTLARRAAPLTGDDLDAALKALDRLAVTREPRAYAVAHPRLAEHRVARLREDGDLDAVEAGFLDWAAESVETLRGGPPPLSPPSAYLVRHYGQHLERAEVDPGRMTHLLTPAWRGAWLAVTDDVAGWLDDIDRVHDAGVRDDEAALAAEHPARWTGRRASCTYLRAEANAAYELVDGVFAGELVRHRLWSEQRAVTSCARIENPDDRAAHLAALAPALTVSGARLAGQLMRTLTEADHEMAAAAMGAVVERLVAEGDLDVARALAEDADSALVRAAGCLATLPAVTDDEGAALLLRIAADGAEGADFVELLTQRVALALARRAFGDPPWRFLVLQLRGTEHWWRDDAGLDDLDAVEQAYAFGLLAPWMTATEREQQLERRLDALAAYGQPWNVTDAVDELAPHLHGDAWHRARAVAADALAAHGRSSQLLAEISLLRTAPPEVAARLLATLIDAIPELLADAGISDVRRALTTLAECGGGEAVLDGLAGLDEGNWEAADHLAAAAPHLDPAGIRRALRLTTGFRRETREAARTALLGRLAQCGDVEAALAEALAQEDDDESGAALVVLRVTSREQPFADIVPALAGIEDRPLRVAVAAVTAGVSPPAAGDLLQVVKLFGDPVGAADWASMEVFEALAHELDDEELLAGATQSVVQYLTTRGLHPRKRAIMVAYYRRVAAAAGVDAALSAARACSTATFDWPLAWAAGAVAGLLEPELEVDRAELLEATDAHRAVVEAATLGLLPPADRRRSLLTAIEDIGSVEVHAGAAALLLEAAPAELYETAADRLLPDALLDGDDGFASSSLWANAMTELCPALDPARLVRVQRTCERVVSGSDRAGLRVAIAVRFASLGQVDQSLAGLDQLDHASAGAALHQIAAVVPTSELPRVAEAIHTRIPYSYWRGPRAYAAAALGRRLGDLSGLELSRLLDRWHARRPAPGETLVDLLAYAPAIMATAGPGAIRELKERVESAGSQRARL